MEADQSSVSFSPECVGTGSEECWMRNVAWSKHPAVTHSLGRALYVVVFSTLFPQCFPVGTVLAYNLQNSVAVSFYKYYVNISPNLCHFVSVQEKKIHSWPISYWSYPMFSVGIFSDHMWKHYSYFFQYLDFELLKKEQMSKTELWKSLRENTC